MMLTHRQQHCVSYLQLLLFLVCACWPAVTESLRSCDDRSTKRSQQWCDHHLCAQQPIECCEGLDSRNTNHTYGLSADLCRKLAEQLNLGACVKCDDLKCEVVGDYLKIHGDYINSSPVLVEQVVRHLGSTVNDIESIVVPEVAAERGWRPCLRLVVGTAATLVWGPGASTLAGPGASTLAGPGVSDRLVPWGPGVSNSSSAVEPGEFLEASVMAGFVPGLNNDDPDLGYPIAVPGVPTPTTTFTPLARDLARLVDTKSLIKIPIFNGKE